MTESTEPLTAYEYTLKKRLYSNCKTVAMEFFLFFLSIPFDERSEGHAVWSSKISTLVVNQQY